LKNGQPVDPEPLVFQGQMIEAPASLGDFFLKVGISVAIGYLTFKYVFK